MTQTVILRRLCSGPGGRGGADTRGAPRMNRRTLLKLAATSSLLATGMPPTSSSADPASALTGTTRRRVRPSDPSWPSLAEWEGLDQVVAAQRDMEQRFAARA